MPIVMMSARKKHTNVAHPLFQPGQDSIVLPRFFIFGHRPGVFHSSALFEAAKPPAARPGAAFCGPRTGGGLSGGAIPEHSFQI